MGLDQGQKAYLGTPTVDYQFWFWTYSPIFLFSIRPYLGPFWTFLGPLGLLLGLGSGLETFLGPTYIDQQLLFWKYAVFKAFSYFSGWVAGWEGGWIS